MGNLQTANKSSDETNEPFAITTWNGAASYAAVNDPLVELFFKSVRDIPCTDYRCITVKQSKKEKKAGRSGSSVNGPKSLEEYFDAAWESDPLRTLKFVFYLRDCRGGKGERKLFRALVRHMRTRNLTEHLRVNMEHIPTFGSWKDISVCFFGTPLEEQAIELITNQLRTDKDSEHPTLCAKYAPSEGGAIDKAHRAATKVATNLGVTLTQYRKRYLVPLRARLNVVEREMCAKQWDEIEYEKVPSIAGSRYKKAFGRHDEQRYTEYLHGVQRGEKKMNVKVLMPYQIVAPYLKSASRSYERDETSEAQWKAFIEDRRTKWPSGMNVLPLIDVSGSMFNHKAPQAVETAVSLGMVFSLLNSVPQYKGKFITFHDHPELLSIRGDSLMDQVNSIKTSKWGGSTNFQSAFDLILNIATTFRVPASEMPQILLVLSDMQFNQADGSGYGGRRTNWEEIERKYHAAGYQRPTIIFWNLNGNSVDYPVPNADVPNCALLSGFNDAIMYSLLDGTMPNPREIVHKALDKDRYDVIHLA
jgi:Mg-chelatase subunit ChlD